MLDVLLFAFSAGLAAAFNPCGIAMFPAYVGYQLGTLDLKQGLVQGVISSLALGLSATMGFVTLFGSVGLVKYLGSVLDFNLINDIIFLSRISF